MKLHAAAWITGTLLLVAGASGCHQNTNQDVAAIEEVGGKLEADPDGFVVTVDLHGCEITESLLASLGHFTELRSLSLHGTDLTDAGFEHLKSLAKLELLDLGGSGYVTGRGLKSLAVMKNLRELDLSKTGVGDDHIKELPGLTGLQVLSLRGTRISDAGLENLAALPGLERLDLCSTQVSDAGLKHIKRFPRLRELFLGGCPRVSEAGVQQLRRAVPEVRAVRRGKC